MKKKKKTLLIALGLGAIVSQSEAQTSSSFNGNTMGLSTIDCSAFGFDALRLGPNTAFGNTAVGHETLRYNTTGEQNTGIGNDVLWFSTIGNANTAVGCEALTWNDAPPAQGDNNTAIGRKALHENVAGDNNSAIGAGASQWDQGGSRNTADGYQAFYSSMGLGPVFVNDNTVLGYKAFRGNTLGGTSIENTAIGGLAGSENINQRYNTIVGNETFMYQYDNQSNENTCVGYKSMRSWLPLSSVNFLSTNNTSMGSESMKNNLESSDNTAYGRSALRGDPIGMKGDRNVALGSESAFNTSTGYENVSVGTGALYNNKTLYGNTAIGTYAMYNNTNGIFSTVVGNYAGLSVDGSFNTLIGDHTDVASLSGIYRTALGSGAISLNDHSVYIGNSSVNSIEGTPLNYTTSDERFKYNVNEKDIIGLDFIMNLRPVDYNFESKKLEEHVTKNLPDSIRGKRLNRKFNNPVEKRESGFIAQEVEKAMENTGYNFHGLKKPEGGTDVYQVRYGVFVVPLVKAVQEQQKLILEGKKKNDALQTRLQEQERLIKLLSNSGSELLRDVLEFETANLVDLECHAKLKIDKLFKTGFIGIYSLSGKQMTTKPIVSQVETVTLDTRNFDPGIYNVSVVTDGEIISTKSILVKRN